MPQTFNHEFLTKEFFESVLQKKYSNTLLQVLDFNLKAAIGKGENYSSDIIRATVRYDTGGNEQRNEQLILKVGLTDSNMSDLLEEFDIFHREIIVYRDILPVVKSLLLSINDKTKLAPR